MCLADQFIRSYYCSCSLHQAQNNATLEIYLQLRQVRWSAATWIWLAIAIKAVQIWSVTCPVSHSVETEVWLSSGNMHVRVFPSWQELEFTRVVCTNLPSSLLINSLLYSGIPSYPLWDHVLVMSLWAISRSNQILQPRSTTGPKLKAVTQSPSSFPHEMSVHEDVLSTN
jgi:hypothetical protein